MAEQPTVAEAIAEVLAGYGVKRIFGIPGGGSSLDVIAACAGRGIDYVLTHTETAAAIMASVTAEITGAPGVVSVGLGPGAAAVANGVAYASLDRAPLLVLTDSYQPGSHDFITHQKYDHQALFAPIAKGSARARPDDVAEVLDGLLRTALATPQGPVHMDLSAADAGQPTAPPTQRASAEGAVAGDVAGARELLDGARRPVVVAGLQARGEASARAVLALAERLSCPAMTTYKAKGVVPDDHPHYAGILTGGRTAGGGGTGLGPGAIQKREDKLRDELPADWNSYNTSDFQGASAASQAFGIATQLDRTNADAWVGWAGVALALRQYPDVLTYANTALETDPDYNSATRIDADGRILGHDQVDERHVRLMLAEAYFHLGRYSAIDRADPNHSAAQAHPVDRDFRFRDAGPLLERIPEPSPAPHPRVPPGH